MGSQQQHQTQFSTRKKESEFKSSQKKVKQTGMLGHWKFKPNSGGLTQQSQTPVNVDPATAQYLAQGRRHSSPNVDQYVSQFRVNKHGQREPIPSDAPSHCPPSPSPLATNDHSAPSISVTAPPANYAPKYPRQPATGYHPYGQAFHRRPSGEASALGLGADYPEHFFSGRRRSLPVNILEDTVHIDKNNLELPPLTQSPAALVYNVKPELTQVMPGCGVEHNVASGLHAIKPPSEQLPPIDAVLDHMSLNDNDSGEFHPRHQQQDYPPQYEFQPHHGSPAAPPQQPHANSGFEYAANYEFPPRPHQGPVNNSYEFPPRGNDMYQQQSHKQEYQFPPTAQYDFPPRPQFQSRNDQQPTGYAFPPPNYDAPGYDPPAQGFGEWRSRSEGGL